MSTSAESSAHLSPTEQAFAEYLALDEEGRGDFEAFCGARPELAPGLRRLHERWRAFDRAVSADLRAEPVAPRSEADASADRLLRGLRRDRADDSRYVASGEIGRGGMGRVLKVWDKDLRRSLAMKVLQEGRKRDPRSLARFLDEALVTGQLEHPGIVPVHELGLDAEGRVYFTMPFVRGENLQRILERVHGGEAGWTRARVLEILVRVCEAVGFAHARGVVHRDLKPANVMVGPFGETYVMDWGLARILPEGERERVPATAGSDAVSQDVSSVRRDAVGQAAGSPLATMDGDVVGTPVYMAPEQAHGWIESVGPATDVYSIGAMLYHLLTGCRPYLAPGEEDSSEAVLRGVKSRAPRPVHALARDVPPELEAICEKAMARDPRQRYASTMELAADLRAFVEQRVVGAYETGALAELRKWTLRNLGLAVAIGAGLIALLAGLATSTTLFLQSRRNETAALQQQQRADASAVRLAAELRTSQLAQGRLAGANGEFARAEDLLWREHLKRPDAASRWLLWELYARFPQRDAARSFASPHDLASTPDGSMLLVSGAASPEDACALLLLDPDSLATLASIPVGDRQARVAVDAGGRRAWTAGLDGDIRAVDLLTRRELHRWTAPEDGVVGLASRPAADAWLLAFRDGSVRALGEDGTVVAELSAGGTVRALAVSSDGALVAAGRDDGSVSVWRDFDAASQRVWNGHRRGIAALEFSPGGERLYATSLDATVTEWDVATGELVATLEPKNGPIYGICAGADGRVALGGNYRIDLVDAASRQVERAIHSPTQVRGIVRPTSDRLTIQYLGSVVNWDLGTSRHLRQLGGASGWSVIGYGADGRLALGDRAGQVQVRERDGGPIQSAWREDAVVRAIALAPNGREVALAVASELRVCDAASGARRLTLPCAGGTSGQRLAYAPDGELLALASGDPEAPFALHRADTGARVAAFGRPGEEAISVDFAPTGEFVAGVTRTKSERGEWMHWLLTWSLTGSEQWRCYARLAWMLDVAPDGSAVAVGQYGREPQVFAIGADAPAAVLQGHTGNAWAVDWHPRDPQVLASCGDDGTVRLWSPSSGALLATIDAPAGSQLTSLRFGPEGETIAASLRGGGVCVWDLTYFDRHVAGNAARQIERLGAELGTGAASGEILAWAAATLARPWPRFAR